MIVRDVTGRNQIAQGKRAIVLDDFHMSAIGKALLRLTRKFGADLDGVYPCKLTLHGFDHVSNQCACFNHDPGPKLVERIKNHSLLDHVGRRRRAAAERPAQDFQVLLERIHIPESVFPSAYSFPPGLNA